MTKIIEHERPFFLCPFQKNEKDSPMTDYRA